MHQLISLCCIIHEVRKLENKGIYKITIGEKFYIGKDVGIDSNIRYATHKRLLQRGNHYNIHLQNAYNKHRVMEYEVLASGNFTKEELVELELFYIAEYDTFNTGYNLTKGGEGSLGSKRTAEFKRNMSTRMSEDNPMSKISKEEFMLLVTMLLEGKTNGEISEVIGLHSRYISLIRHKKRHKLWWEGIGDPEVPSSKGRSKIEKSVLFSILEDLDTKTNSKISEEYGVDRATVSRIRHNKVYQDWINEYKEQGQRLSKG